VTDLAVRPGAEIAFPPGMSPQMRELLAGALAQLQESGQLAPQSTNARAYVYGGCWVADCPTGCNNTEFVTELPIHLRGVAGNWGVRKTMFYCSYCRHIADVIEWPEDAEDITRVLDRRPIPHNRNWYPEGHPVAVKAGIPHGQTVGHLLDENREHGVA
jgi:hypothetical protein